MPVGLVVLEVGSFSLQSLRRLRTANYSFAVRNYFIEILTRARPNNVAGVLLYIIAFYLILSRCGPVLTRVGESAFETSDLNKGLERTALHCVYKAFRSLTGVPRPFAHR